jgi:hypothetical protein
MAGSENIDKIIQRKFENFQPEPSSSVWAGIKSGIPQATPGIWARLTSSVYFYIAATAVVVLGVLFIPPLLNNEPLINPENTFLDTANIPATIDSSSTQKSPDLKNIEISKTEDNVDANTHSIGKFEEESKKNEPAQSIEKTITPEIQEKTILTDSQTEKPSPLKILKEEYSSSKTLDKIDFNRILEIPNKTNNQKLYRLKTTKQHMSYGPLQYSKWELRLFYNIERIYYPEDNIKYKNSQSFDLTGRYYFSEFFIQSGLGIAISDDDANCRIEYQTFELAGTYEDVYDITFDSTGAGMVPVFHTETVEIYDTIDNNTYTPVTGTYTFLQIPVLFGFSQHTNSRFFYDLKAGPLLGLMISSMESEINYPGGDTHIINIENSLPSRIKTSWQFMFSIGLGYDISNNFSLAVEPTFKYYLNSGYEESTMSTKHPYSIGGRAGLIYRF